MLTIVGILTFMTRTYLILMLVACEKVFDLRSQSCQSRDLMYCIFFHEQHASYSSDTQVWINKHTDILIDQDKQHF